MDLLLITLLMMPQQAAKPKRHTLAETWGKQYPGLIDSKAPPVAAKAAAAPPDASDTEPGANYVPRPAASQQAQVTFRDKTGTEDGRMDVMHLSDGRMAIVTGRNWHCSAMKDPFNQDARVVLVCDAPGK